MVISEIVLGIRAIAKIILPKQKTIPFENFIFVILLNIESEKFNVIAR